MALGFYFHKNLDVGNNPFMASLASPSLAIGDGFRISLTVLASWGKESTIFGKRVWECPATNLPHCLFDTLAHR